MSVFKYKMIENLNNSNAVEQVLFNRTLDDYNILNYKNGIKQIDYNNLPTPNISLKLTIGDDKIKYNSSSKLIIDNFYKYRNNLIHADNIGINRFYKLKKDPQSNVIENFNGINKSRIGIDTTQIFKDACN